MNAWSIAGLVAVVIVAWLGFWVGLISMIARLGGWRRLALAYPFDEANQLREKSHPLGIDVNEAKQNSPARKTFAMQSLVLGRFVNYNHVVHFTVREDGLLLTVMRIFRFGHLPMLLRWSDLTAEPTTRMGFKMMRLQARGEPSIPITITAKLAQQLAAAAGHRWPGTSSSEN